MLANKLKNFKTIKPTGLIYSAIFVIYIAVVIIIFIYSLKFLTKNLDMTFAPVTPQNINENYTALDMANYSNLASKLKLGSIASTPAPAIVAPEIPVVSELPPIAEPLDNPEIPTLANALEQNQALKISIVNSTAKNGLAANLKKQLDAAGYPVEKIGNQKLVETNTIIKIKVGLENNTNFLEIKRIISEKYTPLISLLPDSSVYDIEIIIGQK